MTHENAIEKTYLVEHYQPGLDLDGLEALAARVRAAAAAVGRQGARALQLRSTVLPGDETLLCLFETDSEELVRAVYARAGLAFDRITEAISLDDGLCPNRTDPQETQP